MLKNMLKGRRINLRIYSPPVKNDLEVAIKNWLRDHNIIIEKGQYKSVENEQSVQN